MIPANYSTISFPSLGIEVNPGRALTLGPLTIHYYGLIIAVGLMLAVVYACRRSSQFGMKQDDLLDGVLWIGTVLDLVSLGFLIGQSIGRWGNFVNREAFGAATDSFFRMGLYNTVTGAWEYYHPTFLYESVWNAVGFVLLHVLSKHRQYDGEIALGYVAWYGLGRCLIEGLRMDSLYWGSVRVSQLLAGVSCAAAVCILIWQRFRPHDKAELFVNQVAARAAENAAQTPENETKE